MKAFALLVVPAAALALMAPAPSRADDPSAGCGAEECFDGTPVVPSFDPQWSENFVPPALPRLRAISRLGIDLNRATWARKAGNVVGALANRVFARAGFPYHQDHLRDVIAEEALALPPDIWDRS